LDDFGRQQDWQKNRRPKNETGIETGINFERPAFAYFFAPTIFFALSDRECARRPDQLTSHASGCSYRYSRHGLTIRLT
jgi:hypothetical protein